MTELCGCCKELLGVDHCKVAPGLLQSRFRVEDLGCRLPSRGVFAKPWSFFDCEVGYAS